MAALVAPGICRYAINGRYSGRDVVNILDIKIDTTGTTQSRDEVIFTEAGRIINHWTTDILGSMVVDNYTAESVTWVDVDDLAGSTGSRSSTSEQTWPAPGTLSNAAMPGNVAIRVNKQTNAGRGRRQGRMYICGAAESLTGPDTPNQIPGGDLAILNEKLQDFLSGITIEAGLPGTNEESTQLHVVHTIDGVYESSTEVTGLFVDQTMGSQRRRLRG